MPRRPDPNPLAKGIGLRIQQLRREKALTAEKLAYESEVGSKGFMSDIEHGLALPSLTTLEFIAQRLEVSLFDLLVDPSQGDRERLVDLTRGLPEEALAKLLGQILELRPARSDWIPTPMKAIRAYTTLEVAAGWSTQAVPRGEPATETLRLPAKFNRSRDFAVRASGTSMQGFRSTIRDGDWLIMRKAQLLPAAAVGQVALVAREDQFGDKSLHVKRVVQKGRRIWFRSDDPEVKPLVANETDKILATLVSVVTPESLAPPLQTRFPKSQLAAIFGLQRQPSGSWSRVDGHLFFQLKPNDLKSKPTITVASCVPRPAETAFVLLNEGSSVEYLGVARLDSGRGHWRLDDDQTS